MTRKIQGELKGMKKDQFKKKPVAMAEENKPEETPEEKPEETSETEEESEKTSDEEGSVIDEDENKD